MFGGAPQVHAELRSEEVTLQRSEEVTFAEPLKHFGHKYLGGN
jgi:hypothetical protein